MISEQYILVAQVKDVSAQTVNLKVSKDSTTFQQARGPHCWGNARGVQLCRSECVCVCVCV